MIITAELRDKIRALYKDGYSVEWIAQKYNVDEESVRMIVGRH